MNEVFALLAHMLLMLTGCAIGAAAALGGFVFAMICAFCSGRSWGGFLPPTYFGTRLGFGICLAGFAFIAFCASR